MPDKKQNKDVMKWKGDQNNDENRQRNRSR